MGAVPGHQIIQVAIVFSRWLQGAYPKDLQALYRYVSPDWDPDYRPATRPDLKGLLGKSDIYEWWSVLPPSTRRILKAPGRYSVQEYAAALEDAWLRLIKLKKI